MFNHKYDYRLIWITHKKFQCFFASSDKKPFKRARDCAYCPITYRRDAYCQGSSWPIRSENFVIVIYSYVYNNNNNKRKKKNKNKNPYTGSSVHKV